MVDEEKEELRDQLKRYIGSLIEKRNIRINHVFRGMLKSLNKNGSVSNNQWKCLVRFMVIDFQQSPGELREFLNPLIGHKYVQQQEYTHTLSPFFAKEEIYR